MITDVYFTSCENLPPEMKAQLDRPWNFLGEVKHTDNCQICECGKCAPKLSFKPMANVDLSMPAFIFVRLKPRLFITDDMIEVIVYFGTCNQCEAVYWARSGPPFKRARAFVAAET